MLLQCIAVFLFLRYDFHQIGTLELYVTVSFYLFLERYKLHVNVIDQFAETKCMLFDTLAKKFVTQTATELLDGSFDEVNCF